LQLRACRSGARRQQILLEHSQRLASRLGRALDWDVQHVVMTQELLPFIWREGLLGGRTFDVFLTRLPFHLLHERLDEAARIHPESNSLREFRAPHEFADYEFAALSEARWILTPHADLAGLFKDKSILLDWNLPAASVRGLGKRIVFPGAIAARRGAFEMRDAARELGLELVITGRNLEGPEFWCGVPVTRMDPRSDWLVDAAAVVVPGFVENQPREILSALARGVPVIATPACGVGHLPGVSSIPAGNVEALIEAVRPHVEKRTDYSESKRRNDA
jgi:hypothetical protein